MSFPLLSFTTGAIVADSWPMVFDDSGAREDWGWRNEYDLDALVKVMFQYLAPKFGKSLPGLESVLHYRPGDDDDDDDATNKLCWG